MPTEKSQWNSLYRSLKDKVTSDIMEIHKKYKTPTHYKNFMSTIILTNENALRVENDDRRTVFLDVSPSRKGDLNYFKKLGDAMKYPGANEIDIEEIDIETSKKPASDPNALDKFLAYIYNPANNSQNVQEKLAEKKPAPVEENPAPVIRKTPPPLPPKPDHLKERLQELKEENYDLLSDSDSTTANPVPEKPSAPEPDNYDILDDLLSDSDSTTVDPTPEQQPESPAESSASVTKPDPESDTEPEVDQDPEPKEGTRAHWAWHERRRWDRKPWVKNSKDQAFDDLYNTGKELWAKYQDASDEYDWEILAFEVEECLTTRIEDKYQYYFREVVDRFKDWIEYNGYLSKTPSRKELADLIRVYKNNRDAEIIPPLLVMKL
ncbi:hypothetical protein RhiirB3_385079 [Rhizophagus irregularis]|nr:hypothetical protein RhiirB3_385079 [Rhizophagus irregularis]